jgi:nitroreductase
MNGNDLYAAIFKRKSIRNFDSAPLDQNRIEEISEELRGLKPLSYGSRTEFKIISPDQVKRRFSKRAPHYIAAFSEAKGAYMANVGFMLQRMDLYFSSIGLGSCWQGIPKPTKEAVECSNLEFIILMAFGKPTEKLYRSSVAEFKRKHLSKITDIKGAEELLEPARLAPSAVNRQNWFFTGDRNLIHAYSFKPNFIANLLWGKHFPINVGIALCHLQLTAEHFGLSARVVSAEEKNRNPPRNCQYIASLEIEKLQS